MAADSNIVTAQADETLWIYGLALEYEIRPTKRIGLVAGIMHNWLDGDGPSDQATGYSGGITVDVTSSTRLRASAAHRFRFPTLRQLFDQTAGNPNLVTEEADLFELGAEQQIGRDASVGLALFHTNAHNFIERPQGDVQYQNAEQYRFRGVEVTGMFRPVPSVVLQLAYSYLDADAKLPNDETVTLQYRPQNKVTFMGRWTARWGTSAAVNFQYLAGQVYDSRRLPLQQGDLPNFVVLGLRAEQRVPQSPASVYAGVDNLLNSAYEQAYGFPLASLTWYFGFGLQW